MRAAASESSAPARSNAPAPAASSTRTSPTEAIAKAAELAKLGDERGVTYLERPLSFREQLLDMLAQQERDEGATPTDGFAFIANGEVKLAQAMAELRSVLTGPNIQVRCLECPGVAPARVERKDLGFIAAISEWLL